MDKKAFSFRISQRANKDLLEIFAYIAFELASPKAADDLIDRIEERVDKLCDFPYSCSLMGDAFLRERGYRKATVKNFNLFYRVEDNMISIERVLYNRRDMERLF
ncbi:MAG: type II toxin-antitoxin system RelE/ParE family toxin [Clostridiales bacterium]|jgi:addiction module RelE/StbE family toxin|nr:type II toxin-antitoxin system RelE/ParE family toxin [Clostridiales bacterium]